MQILLLTNILRKKIRSNEEISELLLISRSTYYRYMNKAILIFGVMLFGYSVSIEIMKTYQIAS